MKLPKTFFSFFFFSGAQNVHKEMLLERTVFKEKFTFKQLNVPFLNSAFDDEVCFSKTCHTLPFSWSKQNVQTFMFSGKISRFGLHVCVSKTYHWAQTPGVRLSFLGKISRFIAKMFAFRKPIFQYLSFMQRKKERKKQNKTKNKNKKKITQKKNKKQNQFRLHWQDLGF